MRTINNIVDIGLLRQHNVLPHDLWRAVNANLNRNLKLYTEALSSEVTSMADHGSIFVLEPGDNWANLPPAGLHPQFGGIRGLTPEFVELVQIDQGYYWQAMIVLSDHFTPTFWLPAGIDQAVDKHLEAYLEPKATPVAAAKKTNKSKEEQEPDWI